MCLSRSPMAMKRKEHYPTSQPQKFKVCSDRERSTGLSAAIEYTTQRTATSRLSFLSSK